MEIIILFMPTIIAVVRNKSFLGTFLVNILFGHIAPIWFVLLLYAIFKDS